MKPGTSGLWIENRTGAVVTQAQSMINLFWSQSMAFHKVMSVSMLFFGLEFWIEKNEERKMKKEK